MPPKKLQPNDRSKPGALTTNDATANDLPGYGPFLADVKAQIRAAQLEAALSVNEKLVALYWQLGRQILERQANQGWGAKVIDRLAADLTKSFPGVRGFSARNLKYMRAFAAAWEEPEIVQQLLHKLPWGHLVRLLEQVEGRDARLFYARKTLEHGWSRNVLALQIESGLFGREGSAVTNFSRTMPRDDSDLAQQSLKDPYKFDFLTLGEDAHEREIERGLLEHIRAFLLELGVGFAFVGSQYHLDVGGEDFYVDLLFYHLKLRCFIVVDLKTKDFKPEHVGKMNFYLSAVDDQLKHADDKPSIGLILCKTKSRVLVEYALQDVNKPIGVAEYRSGLPQDLQVNLPTIEEIEAELSGTVGAGRDEEA